MGRRLIGLGFSLVIAGCAATGPLYVDDPQAFKPMEPGTARLTIFRASGNVQYSARAATLTLNGAELGSLRLGGYRHVDVPAGTHTLQVDMWDAPGRCTLSVEVAAGTTAYFEVAPRLENFAAGLPGSLVPNATASGMLLGGIALLGGMAAESAGKSCGGAFSITPVDSQAASAQLISLRLSR